MKKILIGLIAVLVSIWAVLADDSTVSVSIKERHTLVTGNYSLKIYNPASSVEPEDFHYYDKIELSSISSSSPTIIDRVIWNDGDVDVFYDIIAKTDKEGLKAKVLYNASKQSNEIELLTEQSILLYSDPDNLNPGESNERNIEIEITNTTGAVINNAVLEIFIIYREPQVVESGLLETNIYITSQFDIERELNSFSLNDKAATKLRIPHFILLSSIIIEHDLVVNIPATFDLLDNDIIIESSMTISHHYYGIYYMNATTGQIINDDGLFEIITPNGFHHFSSDDIIKNAYDDRFKDDFTYASPAKVEYAAKQAMVYLESLFLYDFVEGNVTKHAILNDIVLPKVFFNYPISYHYITSNAEILSDNGHINRADNVDRDVDLTAFLIYNGEVILDEEEERIDGTYTLSIVGKSDDRVFNHTVRELKRFITRTFYRGSFNADILLPKVSEFNKDMHLTYSLEENIIIDLDDWALTKLRKALVDTTIKLTVGYEGSNTKQDIIFAVEKCTQAEKEELLDDAFDVLAFIKTEFYDLFTEELRNEYGMVGVTYEILAYEDDVLDLDLSDEFYGKFEFDNPSDPYKIKIANFLLFNLLENQRLELKVTVNWGAGIPDSVHIYNLIVPEGRAGGEEDVADIESLLFDTFYANAYTITSFDVEKQYLGINITLSGTLPNFVQIVPKNDTIDTIVIDISKIPTTNTTITIKADIEILIQGKKPEPQYYSFVVPGIYHCAPESSPVFQDAVLYAKLLEAISANSSNILKEDEYIQSDETLDLISLNLSNAGITNITGLNKFINLTSLILDNNSLSGSNKLSGLEEMMIDTLSARNCNIEDEDLKVFRTLIMLKNLNLSNDVVKGNKNNVQNLIESGRSYFYRNITHLNLSNQSNLNNILGVEKLTSLVEVDLRNNNILLFEPLLGVKTLRVVYLGGNEIDEDNEANYTYKDGASTGENTITQAYGTSGKLNITTIVGLIDRHIMVYLNSDIDQVTIGNQITDEEAVLARALNAIIYYHTIYIVGGIANLGDFDIVMNDEIEVCILEFTFSTAILAEDITWIAFNGVQSADIKMAEEGSFEMYFKVTSADDDSQVCYRRVVIEVKK